MIIGEIQPQFDFPSFTFYVKVESILESAATGKEVSTEGEKEIDQHFKDDLIKPKRITELKMLKNISLDISPVTYGAFKYTISHYKNTFPQTHKLLQQFLVMPATSVTTEQSFSSIRHVKTYLQTTMKQDQLKYLIMDLHLQRQGH